MSSTAILIVEDEIIIARELESRLKEMGYEVAGIAATGAEAVQLAQETQPILVLMDIVLKGDMDGIEAAAEIRRRFQLPVICLTAYTDERTLERAKVTEPYAYIVKPFSQRELHANIEMALYKHRVESRLRQLERWFASAIHEVGDAVIATDPEGVITVFNPAAEAITEWTRENAVGRKLHEVFRLIDRGNGQPISLEGAHEGPIVCMADHTHLLDRSNREVPVDCTTSYIRDEQNRPTGMVSVFRDVTGKRHGASVALSSEIALATTAALTLRGMLQLCAQAVVRYLNAAFARIWTLDETGSVLLLQASAGMYTHLDGAHRRVPVGRLKIGTIADERKPHSTNDVLHDLHISDPDWARREGIVAFAGHPLVADGRIVGVIAMFSRHKLAESVIEALGTAAKTIAVAIDRKRAEESLRRTQERLQSVLSLSPAVIFALKLQGEKVVDAWVSDNVKTMLGYDPSEFTEQWWRENVHPSDRIYADNQMSRLLERGQLVDEYRFRNAKGDYLCLRDEIRLIRDAAGEPVECIGTWTDITERKRAEEELRETNQNLQAVIQSSPLAIMIFDSQWNAVEWNPAAERIFGWKREEVLGRPLPFVPHELREESESGLRRMFKGEDVSDFETYRLRKDGGRVNLRFFTAPLYGPKGDTIMGILALAQDITNEKKLEEQFRQAQKMEAVGALAGGVAHDFNNLLTVISGYSELLLSTGNLDESKKGLVREISKAGERAAALTRQLLAFSRKQVLEPRILQLNDLVANLEKMLRRLIGEDVILTTVFDPDLKQVKADPGQMEQVVLNLAINSRDAMPQGGKLTIETKNMELDETYAQSHAEIEPGPYVMLAVSDTGCGMTPEVMSRIFEPFFTTKGIGKGTGLGLATVYGIIKQSGGHIAVYSEVDLGTTFKVYFPQVQEQRPARNAVTDLRTMPKGSETILLVEDEGAVRAIARHTLQSCGYDVLEAVNGAEALRFSETHPGPIHLVVTDVVMPEMAGRLVTERIAEMRPETKVLYISGYTDDAVIRHGVLKAEMAFLQKPFSPHSLATKVREVLDEE